MIAIILTALQILLLLLKAHFSKDGDEAKTREHLEKAQAALDAIAAKFELQNRYSNIDPAKMDAFQDTMDKDKKDNVSTSHD
jgi:hypothetical protein